METRYRYPNLVLPLMLTLGRYTSIDRVYMLFRTDAARPVRRAAEVDRKLCEEVTESLARRVSECIICLVVEVWRGYQKQSPPRLPFLEVPDNRGAGDELSIMYLVVSTAKVYENVSIRNARRSTNCQARRPVYSGRDIIGSELSNSPPDGQSVRRRFSQCQLVWLVGICALAVL